MSADETGVRSRGLVVAEGEEFGVAEKGAGGPFGEFDFGFDFGAEPSVVGHFVGGYALAPMASRSAEWRVQSA